MLAEITLDRVEIPDGRRAIDPDAVARLKNSIAVVGLQHPITVAKRDGGYRLLAGAHRLTAFRELGMERISANVVELDDVHAELVELDENLARNELSPAERSAAIARRKAIYERLHPETKHGAVGKGRKPPKGSAKADRFSAATAAATTILTIRPASRARPIGKRCCGSGLRLAAPGSPNPAPRR
jgi:ParB family chromosome partitioning protein